MKKFFAVLTAFIFISTQLPTTAISQETQNSFDPALNHTPTISLKDAPEVKLDVIESHQSIKYESPLSKVEGRPDLERVDFAYANELLVEDFASAVIVESITAKNLKALTEKSIEVGIAVVHGNLVLFTSGDTGEIRLNAAAQELLKNAEIIAHTHPSTERAIPSLTDIELAGSNTEYLVGSEGVYAFNENGLTNSSALDYSVLADLLNSRVTSANTKETRDLLHTFIQNVDKVNNPDEEVSTFRSADPSTVFSDNPTLFNFDGGGAGASSINQTSDTNFVFNYNVTTSGSFSGAAINFDDFGIAGVQSTDLSALSQIVFNTTSTNACVGGKCFKIEFNDALGNSFSFDVSSYGELKIDGANLALLGANVDLSKITQIIFVVEATNTVPAIGNLTVETGGLAFDAFIAPNGLVTSASSFGALDQAVSFSGSGGTIALAQNSTNDFDATFNVSTANSFAGIIYAFDNYGTGAVETADLSGISDLDIGFQLSLGTGTIKVELEDSDGDKDVVYLTGVDTNAQYWRIALSSFNHPDLDLDKITSINVVIENGSVSTSAAVLNVELGTIAFDSTLTPNGLVTSASDLTALDQVVSFSGGGGTNSLNQLGTSEFNLSYNLTSANSFAGTIHAFDNYGTVAIETADLSGLTEIDLGLQLGSGTGTVKVELEDSDGDKDVIYLSGVDTTQRYWRIPLSAFDNAALDLNKITSLNVVVESANISNVIGTLNIELGSVDFNSSIAPNVGVTTPSILAGLDQVVGFADVFATNNFTQSSTQDFSLAFDVTTAGTFVGSISTFDDYGTVGIETQDLSGLTNLDIGLQLNSGTGTIKLEIEDGAGVKDVVYLTGVDTTSRFWRVPLSAFDAAGLDLAAVRSINVIVEQSAMSDPTATLSVQLGSHPFNASIAPNVAVTTPSILAGLDQVVGFADVFATNNFTQSSTQDFSLAFDVTTAGTFVGSISTFDDYGTVGIETQDLSGLTNLDIGLQLNSGTGTIKLEIEDGAGVKDVVYLTGVDTTSRFWRVPLSAFDAAGLDLAAVRSINVIVEQSAMSDPTATLSVQLGSHPFNASIAPNVAVTTPSILAGLDQVVGFADVFATNNFTQSSTQDFSLAFDVTTAGTFVGSISTFDDYGTVGIETQDLSGLTNLDIGLQLNSGTGTIKLEIEDGAGVKDVVYLTGVDTTSRFWRVPLSAFDAAGLDLAAVRSINVIVEQSAMSDPTATLSVQLGSHPFNASIAPNVAVTTPSILAGLDQVVGFADVFATNNFTQSSTQDFSLAFDVTTAGTFVGSISTFDDYGTVGIETQDLSGLTNLDIGLQLNSGTGTIKLEIEDGAGVKDVVYLTGVDTTSRFWRVPLSAFDAAGLDLAAVRSINVIVEQSAMSDPTATLSVQLGSHPFNASIAPNVAVTTPSILAGLDQVVGFADVFATNNFTQSSTQDFSLAFDVTTAGTFVGSISTFDDYGTVGIETQDLSGLTNLDIGLQLNSGTGTIKLEIEDGAGVKDVVYLTGVDTTSRFWRVPLSAFDAAGLDLAAVRSINVIVEQSAMSDPTATLSVQLGSHPFNASIAPNVAVTTPSILAGLDQVVGFADVFATNNFTQSSTQDFSLAFDVTTAGTFVGSISTFDDYGTVGIETQDLSGLTNLDIGLQLNSGTGTIKLEIEDGAGVKDVVYLTGVDTTSRFWRVPLSAFDAAGLDLAAVRSINVIVEQSAMSDPTATLSVQLGSHPFNASIAPNVSIISATQFVSLVQATGFSGSGGSHAFTQSGTDQFSLDVDVSAANSFAGSIFSFDDFGTVAIESEDLSGLTNLDIGLQLSSGSGTIKVEVQDSAGLKDIVYLTGVDTTARFWRIPMSSFDLAGLNLGEVTSINVVLEDSILTDPTVTLGIRLGTIPFNATIDPNGLVTSATDFANLVQVEGFSGASGTHTQTQNGTSDHDLLFDVSAVGSFAGSIYSFDDFGTGAVETADLSGLTQFDIGLQLDSGAGSIKIEIEDSNGITDFITLSGVDTTGRFWRVPLASFDNASLDLSKIVTLTVVVENGAVSDPTATLNILLGAIEFDPEIAPNGLVASATDFADLVQVEGFSGSGGSATQTQNGTSDHDLLFDVSAVGSFAGSIYSFDDFGTGAVETADLSGLTQFDIGLQLDGGAGSVILQIEDVNGLTDTVTLTGVDTTARFWRVPLSSFNTAGLLLDQVKTLTVTVENGAVSDPTATLNILLGAIEFNPEIAPNGLVASATDFADLVQVEGFSGSGGSATQTQNGTSDHDLLFDVSAVGSFAGSIYSFDDFGTGAVETADLSGLTQFDIGLQLDGGAGSVILQIEDVNGLTDTVTLTGVDTTARFWRVPLSSFNTAGLLLDQVKTLTVTVENGAVSDPTATLNILLGAIEFNPEIAPNGLVASATDFADLVQVEGFSGSGGSATQTQNGTSDHNLLFDVSAVGSFAGSIYSFDDFGTGAVETADLSGLTQFDIGLQLDGGAGSVILQIEDVNGLTDTVTLTGVDTTARFWRVPLSSFNTAGLLLDQVKTLTVTVENGAVSDPTATLNILLGAIEFNPEIAPNGLVASATDFADLVQVEGFSGSGGSATQTQNGTSDHDLLFDVSAVGSFAGSIYSFDDFGTGAVETADLSGLTQFDIGLQLDGGAGSVILQIEDVNGLTDTVTLTGVDTTARFWRVPLSSFNTAGLLLDQVKTLTVTVENGAVSDPTATLNILLGAIEFNPEIAPNGLVASATDFADLVQVEGFSGSGGSATQTQNGTSDHDLLFDVSAVGSFAGSIYSFDDFGTGAVETADLSGLTQFDIGLQLDGGAGSVILQIEDVNGLTDTVTLTGVDTTARFWRVPLSSFNTAGLLLDQVKTLTVTVENGAVSDPTATLNILLGAIEFDPEIAPGGATSASSLTGLTNLTSATGGGATVTLGQTSAKDFTLAYGIAAANSFATSISSFDDFGTGVKETQDISGLTQIDIGLQLSSGTGSVVVEVEDENGNKDRVTLTGVTTTKQYWRIPISSFNTTPLDLTKIVGINIVLENGLLTVNTGILTVELGDHPFVPII